MVRDFFSYMLLVASELRIEVISQLNLSHQIKKSLHKWLFSNFSNHDFSLTLILAF